MNYNGCEVEIGALMKYQRNRTLIILISLVFIAGLLAGLTWANYQFSKEYPGGISFNKYWTGMRLLISEGQSPYSEDIGIETQTQEQLFGYLNDSQPSRFANPLYSIIIFIPFSLINDYILARALWMTLLEISLFVTVIVTLRFCKWKTGLTGSIIYMLLAFPAYFSVRALISGDVILITGLFFSVGIWAILKGEDELAGVMFALTTIKPQFGILLAIFLIFWTVNQQRYKYILWFVISISFLTAVTILIKPGWILEFIQANIVNFGITGFYNSAAMLKEIFPGFGIRLGWILSAGVLATLTFEWVKAKKYDSKKMLWLICATLAGGALAGFSAPAESLVLLLPAVILLSEITLEWRKGGSLIVYTLFLFIYLAIPWYAILSTLEMGSTGVEKIVIFTLLLVILILFFWNRHWLMSSVKPLYDVLEPEKFSRKK